MTTADDQPSPQDHQIEALAECAAKGGADGRDALGQLYERYADPLYRYVVCRVKDARTAEDVCSEAWTRVLAGISNYRSLGPGAFAGWLYQITGRLVIDQRRAAGRGMRRRELMTGDMLAYDSPDFAPNPEDAAVRADLAARVARVVNKLMPQQRDALHLRFFVGLSHAETAQVMGVTIGSVKMLQSRGVAAVRRKIAAPAVEHPAVFVTNQSAETRTSTTSSVAQRGAQRGAAG